MTVREQVETWFLNPMNEVRSSFYLETPATVRNPTTRQYVLNKYRVLLTRAREGMIIWVPRSDRSDWTRPSAKYESIAQYL